MASTRARTGSALLGVVVLAGGGVLAATNGYLRAPLPPAAPHLVTAESVCAWRGMTAEPDTSVPLTSPTGDLVITSGVTSRYRVELTNILRRELSLPAASSPVLVATTVSDEPAVVGYALLDRTPEAHTLAVGEAAQYAGFDAFVACPGGPTAPDGVHLAAGAYQLVVGQALGWVAEAEAAPFNTWSHIGALKLTELVTAAPSDEPLTTAPGIPAGQCGSSLDDLPQSSSYHAAFDELEPVLALFGEPFDPAVTITNNGPRDIADVIQGGPLLLVSDGENLVVARTESLDPLPGPALASGATLEFGRFAPLTDCRTGEPLSPGKYQYAVAQQARDPVAPQPFGLSVRYGGLVVTDEADATRAQVELPVLPACGASLEGFAFDPGFAVGTMTSAGFRSREHGTDDLVADPDDGFPVIEFDFVYPGPTRAVWPLGHGVVLARDGVVVARAGLVRYDPFDSVAWPAGSTRSAFLDSGFDCTFPEDALRSYEPAGQYTALGYSATEFEDEWGLPDRFVVTFGPIEVDFGER